MARIIVVFIALLGLGLGFLWLLGGGLFGRSWEPGVAVEAPVPAEVVAERGRAQKDAARRVGVPVPAQILFGDLHVHSTYSTDAFLMSLPLAGGEGAHPVSDACDFARYCSGLDFWSINDHAMAHTPRSWRETLESIRQCNAIGGESPDVAAFLGWEWTQIGTRPSDHYGHKNVIVRDLDEGRVPTRPIAARPPPQAADRAKAPPRLALGVLPFLIRDRSTFDLLRYIQDMGAVPDCPEDVSVQELPDDCREWAATPRELFKKLDEWGLETMVIPHGTTWGYYTPQGSTWDKQLRAGQHDPARQGLIEIFSGHGNSEEYRDWEEVVIADNGQRRCPRPRADYLPSCWRAGEIIRARCAEQGESADECEERAVEARQHYVDADVAGHKTVPGAGPDEWLDSGQCRDCFQPSFNYRPRSSVQYIMALRNFDAPGEPRRFDFGFMASSDNHSSRPGTGYKEFARAAMTEARFGAFAKTPILAGARVDPVARSRSWDGGQGPGRFFAALETERQASFFLTGGLVAVHAKGRDRASIWDALERKEVYGTSGPRILLWFDLLNPPGTLGRALPMGSSTRLDQSPIFRVRASGSREQAPGCPESSTGALGPDAIARLCRGECYNPTDRRRSLSRIEVVRIRPQRVPGEDVSELIEDPWRVFPCDGDPDGCSIVFGDPEFTSAGRDTLYYVRAIEVPSPAVNAGGLRCKRDASGSCVEPQACRYASEDDDCLTETEERAWSSPIFVSFGSV